MSPEIRKQLYFRMLRIRRIEEAIAAKYSGQEMRCPVHLSIGQEAIAVGVSAHLSKHDRVYSNHRCHAHYLAKGGDLGEMLAELHGKVTGCAHGKGGSMHLVSPENGMMGASAIVGGTIPLAVGSALAMATAGQRSVAVAFFGDGATEEGIFWESLNFAALKRLPVLLVCENNLYATYSHQRARQANCAIAARARAFGATVEEGSGNDVAFVYEATQRAVERARRGQGPTFLELMTYRWKDHVGPGDDIQLGYRTAEELLSWKEKCPIKCQERILDKTSELSMSEIDDHDRRCEQEIAKAFQFAQTSPLPSANTITQDIYA